MDKTIAIVLAIALITILLIIFFVSYVFNKKTPIPENCRDLVDQNKCDGCKQYDCAFNNALDDVKGEKK